MPSNFTCEEGRFMVHGKWDKSSPLMKECQPDQMLQCVDLKCSLVGLNSRDQFSLTLHLTQMCANLDFDLAKCPEMSDHCTEMGGVPSCEEFITPSTTKPNWKHKPTIACLSGKVNAGDNAVGLPARVCGEGKGCFTRKCYSERAKYSNETLLYTAKGCIWEKDDEDEEWRARRACESQEYKWCDESCCNGEGEEETRSCDALYKAAAPANAAE
ncbi:hypothetical protein niasHS_009376 [Heterodera schachtii]|uniref:ADAMTS cysteine-rich domain-containing protein n=2 Tax=Heterodera TaxID=34509 RepID=A0ABD2JBW9_HETSC